MHRRSEARRRSFSNRGLDSPGLEGRLVLRDLVGDVGEVALEKVLDPLRGPHALVSLIGVHLDTKNKLGEFNA